MTKLVKLSMIRKEGLSSCPYGLEIPFACLNLGELENKLIPINNELNTEDQEKIKNFNLKILKWYTDGKACKFLNKLFKEHNAVECSFESDGSEVNLIGSPFYSKYFAGVSLDGLYSVPLGAYVDNSIDRGQYFGMYSIESIAEEDLNNETIKKSSNK